MSPKFGTVLLSLLMVNANESYLPASLMFILMEVVQLSKASKITTLFRSLHYDSSAPPVKVKYNNLVIVIYLKVFMLALILIFRLLQRCSDLAPPRVVQRQLLQRGSAISGDCCY